MKYTHRFAWATTFLAAAISGCGGGAIKQEKTLADIDTVNTTRVVRATSRTPNPATKQSEAKIKEAYYQYIRNAKKNDNSRRRALNRLAELELSFTQSLIDNEDSDIERSDAYRQSLAKTALLLETALNDYPKAPDNDRSLYQLARTYDQLDQYEQSDEALLRLIARFPKSDYYVEAQFRIAERAFAGGDYITAEDAYTEVVLSPLGDRFYDKSLFKRGWARYKQQLPEEALDDYIQVAESFNNEAIDKLRPTDKNIFDETLRAIALSSFQLEPTAGFYNYLQQHPEFKFVFESYSTAADLYVKQERFADASQTLNQFISHFSQSKSLPLAFIQDIEIWKLGGFQSKIFESIDRFYQQFNPNAAYWSQTGLQPPEQVSQSLRSNMIVMANHFHAENQKRRQRESFTQAQSWYERYLKFYPSFAFKNNVYGSYASLLAQNGLNEQALGYFETAAFNDDVILNKDAAYSAITIASDLYDKNRSNPSATKWLEKYLQFSQPFIALYPTDKRSSALALRSAELSYQNKQYARALAFSELAPNLTAREATALKNIRAKAFFDTQDYISAEALFTDLSASRNVSAQEKNVFNNSLAIAIYKQGEIADEPAEKYRHFSRISQAAPNTEVAATGLFDAIAIVVNQKQWKQSIVAIERFKKLYPNDKKVSTVNKSLTVAYLNSDQQGKAAAAFEQLALTDSDANVKRAALWKAGELYEKKNQYTEALRTYRDLANRFAKPFDQNLEAMFKLVELYGKTNNKAKALVWQDKIRRTNSNTTQQDKTERTEFIAAHSTLELASASKQKFEGVRLREPLATNLRKKKKLMQDTIKLYGQASAFGLSDITTQATHEIALIYKTFGTALIESERPRNLNADELEQYEILLEDQAFPFEEKAIEFFETNISRVKDNSYTKWIGDSFKEVQELFPVRYSRKGKIGIYDE